MTIALAGVGEERGEKSAASSGRCPRTEEPVVFARTTTIQADPTRIDDGIAHVRNETIPHVTEMSGCLGMSLLVDHASGRCIATTAWESEEALQASADQVRPMRDEALRVLGAEDSTVETWEVAAVHREHAVPDGACARVTWLSGDPSTAERAIDAFKLVVLPRVQELEGFCSGSMLIDREAGRAVGTVIYDTREQLESSRDATAQIREGVIGELGARLDEVAEMEVALAHLHVPELA
jgi:quinol monooxygenase YgiN